MARKKINHKKQNIVILSIFLAGVAFVASILTFKNHPAFSNVMADTYGALLTVGIIMLLSPLAFIVRWIRNGGK